MLIRNSFHARFLGKQMSEKLRWTTKVFNQSSLKLTEKCCERMAFVGTIKINWKGKISTGLTFISALAKVDKMRLVQTSVTYDTCKMVVTLAQYLFLMGHSLTSLSLFLSFQQFSTYSSQHFVNEWIRTVDLCYQKQPLC